MGKPKKYRFNVFINCPFDNQFKPILYAIIFAIKDSGFIPHYLLEKQTSKSTRWNRLLKIISDCKFAVHDLSCTEVDRNTGFPRFNMTLELGVFLGSAFFGTGPDRTKDCVILERTSHDYDKFCSDLSGSDCKAHDNDPKKALEVVRNWLSEHTQELLPSKEQMWRRYQEFIEYLSLTAAFQHTSENKIYPRDFMIYLKYWFRSHRGITS